MVYELKITLEDVGVPVWRTVHIEKDANFFELHRLLQVTFDWQDSHLYGFFIDVSNGEDYWNVQITRRSDEEETMPLNGKILDEAEEALSDWFIQPGDKINYTYDFGDNWEHEIEFIQELEPDPYIDYPICTEVKNLAPPEDSRPKVLQGKVDLISRDNTFLMMEINTEIEVEMLDDLEEIVKHLDWGDDLLASVDDFDSDDDPLALMDDVNEEEAWGDAAWSETLATAKKFLEEKPWEALSEQDIFVIQDPRSKQYLFCRLVGGVGDKFGLEIYLGMDGFFALLEMMAGEEMIWDGLQHEEALFVSFVDRNELKDADYTLIKQHDTAFRGKKSWPTFISYEPGYFPWMMNVEEGELARFAMAEVLAVMKEQESGLILPNILRDEKILIRELDEAMDQAAGLTSRIVQIESLLHENIEEQLELSELEIKRFSKIRRVLPCTIEFAVIPLDIPIQHEAGKRPFYPYVALAVDAETGETYFQEILENQVDLALAQRTFFRAVVEMGGIPEAIYTDPGTARVILPFLDVQDFDIGIEEELDMIDILLDDLVEQLTEE